MISNVDIESILWKGLYIAASAAETSEQTAGLLIQQLLQNHYMCSFFLHSGELKQHPRSGDRCSAINYIQKKQRDCGHSDNLLFGRCFLQGNILKAMHTRVCFLNITSYFFTTMCMKIRKKQLTKQLRSRSAEKML